MHTQIYTPGTLTEFANEAKPPKGKGSFSYRFPRKVLDVGSSQTPLDTFPHESLEANHYHQITEELPNTSHVN